MGAEPGFTVEQLVAAQRHLETVRAWLSRQGPGWVPTSVEARVIADAKVLAGRINRIGEQHPIALTRLWTAHCPRCGREMAWVGRSVYRCAPCGLRQAETDARASDCRTSQRATLRELGEICTLITGSNRAGKTYLGCLLAVLWLYGAGHWAVQSFLALNGLPADLLGQRDNLVWYSSLSNELNLARQRTYFDELLPPTAERRSWAQRGSFAEVLLHEEGGGRLQFKANDQGWKKYQGDHVDLIVLDEEHEERVYQECLSRTGTEHGRTGRTVLTMTPTGRTYVYRSFVVEPAPGHSWSRIVYRDNPHVDAASLDARLDRLPAEIRDAKKYGLFGAAGAMIFPRFDRLVHVVGADWRAPRDWMRLGAVDFGFTNPFCYLHIAYHPKGRQRVVLFEHYQAGWRTQRHAPAIKAIWRADQRPDDVVCDSEDPQGRLALEDAGVACSPARKGPGSVKRGLELLGALLAVDEFERPGLLIHPRCENLIREMEGLQRKKLADDKDEKGTIVTVGPNHAVDCLRYGEMTWQDEYGWRG